jgi:predicted transcriptional regulator
MTLQEIKEILDAVVLVGHDRLDMEIPEGGCSDLITEIPIYGKAGIVLLTGLVTHHVITAASDISAAAVIMVRGKRPSAETIQIAENLHMPLLTTDYILYEAVGRLYTRGLKSCMEMADRTS